MFAVHLSLFIWNSSSQTRTSICLLCSLPRLRSHRSHHLEVQELLRLRTHQSNVWQFPGTLASSLSAFLAWTRDQWAYNQAVISRSRISTGGQSVGFLSRPASVVHLNLWSRQFNLYFPPSVEGPVPWKASGTFYVSMIFEYRWGFAYWHLLTWASLHDLMDCSLGIIWDDLGAPELRWAFAAHWEWLLRVILRCSGRWTHYLIPRHCCRHSGYWACPHSPSWIPCHRTCPCYSMWHSQIWMKWRR